MSLECYEKRLLVNGVSIPAVMLGSFRVSNEKKMRMMVEAAFSAGCVGFDTSPSYGTEQMLGNSLRGLCRSSKIDRSELFVADKVDGIQMYKSHGDVEKYVDESLRIMNMEYFDLLLIHWPMEKYITETWKSLERMYQKGKVRSIGLCNVNFRVFDEFINRGVEIVPHVVQNEISPLRTCLEEVAYFQNKKIMVQSYSPLCQMHKEIITSESLIQLSEIYKKSIPQIILRWHVERGIIPIFTSEKPTRIRSNLDIFDFSLKESEIEEINSLHCDYKIFPESYGCPGF